MFKRVELFNAMEWIREMSRMTVSWPNDERATSNMDPLPAISARSFQLHCNIYRTRLDPKFTVAIKSSMVTINFNKIGFKYVLRFTFFP